MPPFKAALPGLCSLWTPAGRRITLFTMSTLQHHRVGRETSRWRSLLTLALFAGLTGLTGCAVATGGRGAPAVVDRADYDRYFAAAVDVLRDEGFIVQEHSYRFGRITTAPRPAPTILEPWDQSSLTIGDSLSSTLNQQRRVVDVLLEPNAEGTADTAQDQAGFPVASLSPADVTPTSYTLVVKAVIQQREVPSGQLSGTTIGPRILNTLSATPAELSSRGIPGEYWRTVASDPALSAHLLRRIFDAAKSRSQRPPEAEPATPDPARAANP